MTSTVGRYAAAVRVEAPSVTTRDRRELYPPIGLDPCIVNGRLRHTGQGASRHAPPCVVSRVGFSVLQTSSTGARTQGAAAPSLRCAALQGIDNNLETLEP